MALTPSGFQVISAQGQVQLQWSITPLAVSYYIFRSTDSVTFAQIATTSSVIYSDKTAVLNTIYYYQVQSFDGTSVSVATPSIAGQSLKPGQTTVGNLRLEIQQRTNKENSPFYTTQEWNTMINNSYKELYDILLSQYGDDYYIQVPYTYTTSGQIDPTYQTQVYPLPNDFYKMMRVEVALNPADPNSWITLKKFQAIQANLWNYPNIYTLRGITNLRYRVWGVNLQLVPLCAAGQTLRIWYSPRPNQLINDTDVVDAVSGWEEYIVTDVAIKALTKSEEDVSVFGAQKAAMLKRINEISCNRDIGEPEIVSDSRTRNFAWSGGDTPIGWGGGSYG